MSNYYEKRKSKIFIISFLIMWFIVSSGITTYAFEHKKARIDIYSDCSCVIKNAEGQQLVYDSDKEKFSGDMDILDEWEYGYDMPKMKHALIVEDSDSFSFESLSKEEAEFDVEDAELCVWVTVTNYGKVYVDTSNKNKVYIEGNNFEYILNALINRDKFNYVISGISSKKITFTTENNIGILSGVADCNINLEIWNFESDFKAISSVYSYEDTITLSQNGTKIIAPGTGVINNNTTKNVSNVYIASANNDKNLMLTWNKVKGAKSYIVYRYNAESKKYEKQEVLSENYMDIPNPSSDAVYRYKVAACRNSLGIGGRIGKVSYAVSSVSPNNEKSNVVNVKLNRNKTLKLKRYKTKSIKALLKGTDGKNLYSKNIRWYCSNKKVATVSKSGKIKAKRKGTCYVWAKAHNGTNSKHLKIVVK